MDKDDPNAEGTNLGGGYSKIFEIKNYLNSTPSVDVVGADLKITGAYLILPITKFDSLNCRRCVKLKFVNLLYSNTKQRG